MSIIIASMQDLPYELLVTRIKSFVRRLVSLRLSLVELIYYSYETGPLLISCGLLLPISDLK